MRMVGSENEDHAVEKTADSRVTIRAAVDAYLESLRIKNRPKKTISGKTYELGLFARSCKKSCGVSDNQ